MQKNNAAKHSTHFSLQRFEYLKALNTKMVKPVLLTMAVTVFSSGCALTAKDKTAENNALENKANSSASSVKASLQKTQDVDMKMNSQTMFELMAAELLLKRKQPQAAFNTLYPLAEKYRTGELAERAFQMSMMTYNLESIDKATQLWKQVSPESAVAWRAAFILSLRNDQLELALEEFDKFQNLSEANLPSDLIASASKVGATVSEAKGLAFFEAITKQYPEEWASFYALGMVSAIYNNADVGIKALETAEKMMQKEQTGDSEALIFNLLSKLYLTVQPPQKGVDALRPYVEANPDDLLVQERLARLEVQARLYDDAERRYSLIVEKEPQAYTSLFSLALLQMERKAYDESAQNLLKVSKQKGYQSVGFYYLGMLHQEMGKTDKALTYFAQVKSAGYKLDATLHTAEILYNQGDKQKALDLLDSINATNQTDKVKVLRAKAIFITSEEDYQQAIKIYDEVLALEPTNLNVIKSQSLLFYSVEDFKRYEETLLQALKIDSQDSELLNALGYFYVENNMKLDDAFILLEKALSLDPESYFILDSMGWYYYQRGDYKTSLSYLNQAFDSSKDEEVFMHLIAAYWANGEQNVAKDLWQKYRDNFKANEKVQNLINDLEQGKVP